MNPKVLKPESSLAEVVDWLKGQGDALRASVSDREGFERLVETSREAIETVDWLEGAWKPEPEEVALLGLLLHKSLKPESGQEPETVLFVILDLLALPEILWPTIIVDVERGDFRLSEEFEVTRLDEVERVIEIRRRKENER